MFRVSADIQYLDGALAGMVIPAGYACSFPNNMRAYSVAARLKKVQRADDFIRAAGTGNRYKVVGNVTVERI